jgi:hypothetical protein
LPLPRSGRNLRPVIHEQELHLMFVRVSPPSGVTTVALTAAARSTLGIDARTPLAPARAPSAACALPQPPPPVPCGRAAAAPSRVRGAQRARVSTVRCDHRSAHCSCPEHSGDRRTDAAQVRRARRQCRAVARRRRRGRVGCAGSGRAIHRDFATVLLPAAVAAPTWVPHD